MEALYLHCFCTPFIYVFLNSKGDLQDIEKLVQLGGVDSFERHRDGMVD